MLVVLGSLLVAGTRGSSAAQTKDVAVRADAYVRSDRPNGNFGANPWLRVDGSPRLISYVRLPGNAIPFGATLTQAVLHVWVEQGNDQGFSVRRALGRWGEKTVTWGTRPRLGTAIGLSGPSTSGTWIDVEVTAAIGSRWTSIALVSRDPDRQTYAAREGDHPPLLTLTYEPAPPPSGQLRYRYIFNSSSDPASVAANGWNLLDISSGWQLDGLPAGTKALVWVGNYRDSTCGWQISNAELETKITAMAGSDKVAGYFFSDEPDPAICPNAPAQHVARSDLIHALDPGTFTVLVIDSNSGVSAAEVPLWVDAADYVGLNPYPCLRGEACDYAQIDEMIAAADASGLTYWGVVQAFADSEWRWPTAAEERHMLAQWAASNWKGYMTFAWTWAGNSLGDQQQLLAVLKDFNENGI